MSSWNEIKNNIQVIAKKTAKKTTKKTAAKKISTVMDEFHTYALEWTPEYIKTYVDGVQLFHYNPDNYP